MPAKLVSEPRLSNDSRPEKQPRRNDNEELRVTNADCRLCGAPLTATFVDLGMSPLCESYVPAGRLDGRAGCRKPLG